jgi:hypothetical protein
LYTPDPYWCKCKKCQVLAFWDGSRKPGPCPTGGVHDHNDSHSYIPPHFKADTTYLIRDLQVGVTHMIPNSDISIEVSLLTDDEARLKIKKI